MLDKSLLKHIQDSYLVDPWCKKLLLASMSMKGIEQCQGLWYIGLQLVIPWVLNVREGLF